MVFMETLLALERMEICPLESDTFILRGTDIVSAKGGTLELYRDGG